MPEQTTHAFAAPLLPSLPNLRDLGGHHTRDGRQVRRNRFFRSPRLTDMTAADRQWLSDRDIAMFVDFRGVQERAVAPLDLPAALLPLRISLSIEPGVGPLLRAVEAKAPASDADVHAIMVELYTNYVRRHGAIFAEFLRLVAEEKNRATVFHCSAGKDRTGFAAALLLTILDVPQETIMEDYLRTNDDWVPPADIQHGVPAAYRSALLGVRAAYLDAAFAELDRNHGGAEAFAAAALGGQAQLMAFRERETCPL
ncbi:MAG: tyrosine-protein phosphatase [Rhizobiaceae bacterium]|nr:tyrosine-protein phosphatase [Rhizobiaceae bacterium]